MICLAVKADAYGHGIAEIGHEAEASGIDYLAVATVDEAVDLRNGGVTLPVLLYSLPTPEEIAEVLTTGAIPVVSDLELATLIQSRAAGAYRTVDVHLKIDTGMGRIGCRPEEAAEVAAGIADLPNLHLAGVSTHFATSDSPDRRHTQAQIERFSGAVDAIRRRGINPGIVHAANSGGVLQYPDAWFDMVRPGILAYGYPPADDLEIGLNVLPVMELRSKLILIKEVGPGTAISYGATWTSSRRTHIGTIPVGYGDGYNRLLSNHARVLIRGKSYPVVGRVCMDHVMVDLGPTCEVERFDDVVMFGPDTTGPDAAELARICDTIPYEITCAISKRVPRIYVD